MATRMTTIQSGASTSAAPLDALDGINVEEVSKSAWRAVFDAIGSGRRIDAAVDSYPRRR